MSQAHQIAGIVFKVLVGHRVAQQVRMQLEAADRSSTCRTTPESHGQSAVLFRRRRPDSMERVGGLQGKRQGLGGQAMGSGHRPLLVPLPIPKHDRAAPLANHQIMEVQVDEIADPAARVEHDGEDRRRPNVAPQFDFTQQLPHLGSVQPFRERGPFASIP